MPVYKYRRVEDMPEAWEHFGDRNRAGRIRAVLRMARAAGPLGLPRGVTKFRSIEEMSADRERYEQERIDRVRSSRSRKD
jgi:hypothetical protein